MKKNLNKYKLDLIIVTLITFMSLFIRVIKLDSIPTNISGDEITNLSDIYRLLFGTGYHIFSFMGDGSVAGINFYWPALLIKAFGLQNTIFALRLSTSIQSIFSLIPFYFLLKTRTSRLISLIFTLLLSSNYVFLNFSRTAWVNMGTIFSGLSLILLLEKAEKEKKKIWYLLAGIFAGITLYGYHYGKIFVGSILLYLLLTLVNSKNRNSAYVKKISIFLGTTLIIFLPFLILIISDGAESILRRPDSIYVFSSGRDASLSTIFQHQIEYSLKGFITLDKTVMSEGVENQRYLPIQTPPVDFPIKLLFIPGLLYAIFFRRDLRFWWALFISLLFTQIVTDFPPNFSRGLFYIPFIYFISALFFYKIWHFLKKISLIKKFIFIFITIFISTFILLGIGDVNLYFEWMKTKDVYAARQPAIDYNEFFAWQNYQINLIKNGKRPIVNQEWYQIRNYLLKKN